MNLERFIKSVRMEVAKKHHFNTDSELDAFFLGLEESAKDNQEALEKRDNMLRDTVAELSEAKRLLKAAVNEMAQLGEQCSDNAIHCCNCPFEECGKFSFHDEIMELIGGEE